jgi:aminodeoxyfutalosine deaminase
MTRWNTLPKVELHCHLLGVISPALLARIRDEGGQILVEPETLAGAYPVSSAHSFQCWVDTLKPYQTASAEAMRPVLAAHVSDLIAERVVYTEIMISPSMFPRGPGALLPAFQRWRDWAFELEQGRIQVEFLFVVPRRLEPEALERDTAAALELRRAGLIAGVALVGMENGESLQRFAPSFDRWREAGLGVEIHAGEHTGPKSVWDALTYGRPGRLGHALSAFDDQDLLDYIASHEIHIEFCPTSNLKTGAIADLRHHPIRTAKELGLSFSLNTDDPGAFGSSLEDEYRLAAEFLALQKNDFAAVFEKSLAARFEPRLRYLNPAMPAL